SCRFRGDGFNHCCDSRPLFSLARAVLIKSRSATTTLPHFVNSSRAAREVRKVPYRTNAAQHWVSIRAQASPRLFCLHLHRSAEALTTVARAGSVMKPAQFSHTETEHLRPFGGNRHTRKLKPLGHHRLRSATGQPAAPPSSVINSRRPIIRSPRRRG